MNDDRPDRNRPWHRMHLWQFQPVRDVLVLAVGFGLLYLGHVLSAITVPMLLALGLSYLFEPLIVKTSRRFAWATRQRLVVSMLVVLGLGGLLVATTVLPVVAGQVAGLARNAGRYFTTALTVVDGDQTPDFLRERIAELREAVGLEPQPEPTAPAAASGSGNAAVDEAPPEPVAVAPDGNIDEAAVRAIVVQELAARDGGSDGLSGLGGKVFTAGRAVVRFVVEVAGGVVAFAFGAFLVGFFFFVFSTSFAQVLGFLRSLIPEAHRERSLEMIGRMDLAVAGFVRGRMTIAAILGVVFAVGWTVCGVPYGLALGLVVGVFTIVPYLAGLGLIAAYALLVFHLHGDLEQGGFYIAEDGIVWWKVVVFPGIVFVIAQALDDYVLTPLIQGKATNLSMASIMVAVLAGGILAGVYGMLLAIPFAACVKILLSEILWPRIQSWLRGEREDPLPLD